MTKYLNNLKMDLQVVTNEKFSSTEFILIRNQTWLLKIIVEIL